jgi:Ca-activated chloride channel family protein
MGMIGLIGHGAGPAATAAAASGAGGAWAADIAAPVMRTTPRLDPNARYATTYRPGGAALAAFDSAVSRGQIPGSYRDLVGDFGARYAPVLAAPATGALTIAVQTERAAVGPGGGSMNLMVGLASSATMPSRAPLSVHIVLDISGSMSGQAIEDAKHAAEAAVDKLDPSDDFSMVTFSNEAQVLVADGPIGPRRAQVLSRIAGVAAGGGTNISAGLDLGYAEAHVPGISSDAVRLVMLLSDGHANAGDTPLDHLADRAARAFQDGIQTSSFGLGPDYDAALMSKIADRGAGGYYYLADSSQIAPALSREIDARLRPVATAVEIRVRLRPDVSATHVYGSRELSADEADAVRAQELAVDRHEAARKTGIAADRQIDAEGGMRFFIPAFAPADRHATMVTLQLPPGTGERRIASVEVRYKDRLLQKNMTQELPVTLRWAASDAESAATANHDVERMEQAFAAGETILEAAEDVDHADRQGARKLLDERASVLRSAAALLGEPRFNEDAGRLQRLSDAVGGSQAIADALPLVVMLRGSGYGYL